MRRRVVIDGLCPGLFFSSFSLSVYEYQFKIGVEGVFHEFMRWRCDDAGMPGPAGWFRTDGKEDGLGVQARVVSLDLDGRLVGWTG